MDTSFLVVSFRAQIMYLIHNLDKAWVTGLPTVSLIQLGVKVVFHFQVPAAIKGEGFGVDCNLMLEQISFN